MKIGEEIGGFWVRVKGVTNLCVNGLWWMIVVFDRWIMFGMKFGEDWRKLWRFESFRLWRFRERVEDERSLCWLNEEEEEINLVYGEKNCRARPCYCRHGSCQLSGKGSSLCAGGLARLCNHGHGSCQVSGLTRQIFFRFLASNLDKYLQNKLKQHKTNKLKAIKLVDCRPRSARLKLLA